MRSMLLLCAVTCATPFTHSPQLPCRMVTYSPTQWLLFRCRAVQKRRQPRPLFMGSSANDGLEAVNTPMGRHAPRRLPPGGASTFWDRESSFRPTFDHATARKGDDHTEVIVLGTSRPHTSTVIWLHGNAGDPPRGWLRALAKLSMPWCKFLLPVAASRPCRTGPTHGKDKEGGDELLEHTRGWDDDSDNAVKGGGEGENLWNAVKMVHDLIDREAEFGVQPEHVVVGGFGQGAAVALLASLTYPRQLAGAASFAGYLPPSMLRSARSTRSSGLGGWGRLGKSLDVSVAAAYLPVLLCHGSRDAVVPLMTGLSTYKALASLGTRPCFRSSQGVGHGVSAQVRREYTLLPLQEHVCRVSSIRH
jgi:predicted esterase